MSKHTPGPWKIWDNGSEENPTVVIASEKMFIVKTIGENDQANARLIKEAPQMYKLLQEIADAIEKKQLVLVDPEILDTLAGMHNVFKNVEGE